MLRGAKRGRNRLQVSSLANTRDGYQAARQQGIHTAYSQNSQNVVCFSFFPSAHLQAPLPLNSPPLRCSSFPHSSSRSPLTSSTVPVLPPFAPPARIDFVLVNLEQRGSSQGGVMATERKWTEPDAATSCAAWWSFHHLDRFSNLPPIPNPTTTGTTCTPVVLLHTTSTSPLLLFPLYYFFFVRFLSLSFSLNLQDVSKYHAGLQTGRWQTIKGRCRLIISSALWLTSISPRSHWAAAGRGENMQSGGLHSSQIYRWLFRPSPPDGHGEQLYVTQDDLKFNWADFILFAVGVRAEIRTKGQYFKSDSSLSTCRESSETNEWVKYV